MNTKKYIKLIFGVLCVLCLFWLIERRGSSVQGAFLLGFDSLLELVTSVIIFTSPQISIKVSRTAKFSLGMFFLCLAWADLSWALSFFVFKLDSRLPWVVFHIAAAYSAAFIFGSLSILFSLRSSVTRFLSSPVAVLPLLITVPVGLRFLVIPFINSARGHFLTPFNIGEMVAIGGTFILMNLALIVLLSAKSLFWSFFSAAMVSVIFGDWAMRVEKLLGTVPVFGIYEFYWSFGIFLCTSLFLFFRDEIRKIEDFDPSSLLCNYKLCTILVIFVSIVFMCISQQGNLAAIKIISISCGIGAILSVLVGHLLVERVQFFSERLAEIVTERFISAAQDTPARVETTQLPSELNDIYKLVFVRKIQEQELRQTQEIAVKLAQSRAELSSQVAHDIRSPLAALDMVVCDIKGLQEDRRVLVRGAIRRIKDIANNLIEAYKPKSTEGATFSGTSIPAESIHLLSSVIDGLVSEKRMQFRQKLEIEIEARLNTSSYGIFSSANIVEFKRIISNLINNAVEASGDKGMIEVLLAPVGEFAEIRISDQGRGISPQILKKLGKKGETHGKQGGLGLGLFHARRSLERWGGSFRIESDLGKGTTVTLRLPRVAAPDWFVPELVVAPGSAIVVLDDDSSIHQIWQGRFDALQANQKNTDLKHFSCPEEIKNWFEAEGKVNPSVLFLIDYELIGKQETGLNIIEDLGIQDRSILVTSRFEEPCIRERCQRLKVRLIPKDMAGFVPIAIGTRV